ncbi:hypothetical protein BD410DRAFT_806210 [Rickenella mellea]|uniref:Uncharacterized protein n=1 Tax=Rickenella mellea TaxID=50990 RepID=A0A4Y7PV94_9AGAM|nr:hypothetical protein BD410DRAFT_806210 [Rickenella mellea]
MNDSDAIRLHRHPIKHQTSGVWKAVSEGKKRPVNQLTVGRDTKEKKPRIVCGGIIEANSAYWKGTKSVERHPRSEAREDIGMMITVRDIAPGSVGDGEADFECAGLSNFRRSCGQKTVVRPNTSQGGVWALPERNGIRTGMHRSVVERLQEGGWLIKERFMASST